MSRPIKRGYPYPKQGKLPWATRWRVTHRNRSVLYAWTMFAHSPAWRGELVSLDDAQMVEADAIQQLRQRAKE